MIDIAFSGTRLTRSVALEWQESVLVSRDISALIAEGTVHVTAHQASDAVRLSAAKALEYEVAELVMLSESFAAIDSNSGPLAATPQLHDLHFETVELSTSDALILSTAKLSMFDRVRLIFSIKRAAPHNRALGYGIRSGSSKKLLELSITDELALNVSLRN